MFTPEECLYKAWSNSNLINVVPLSARRERVSVIFQALQRCQEENVMKLLGKTNLQLSQVDLSRTDCPALNISQCEVSESAERFLVVVYNPLSRPVDHYVRIPVTQPSYQVYDHLGQELETQFNEIPRYIRNIPGGNPPVIYD